MTAFNKLKEITKSLTPYGICDKISGQLIKCISTAHGYIRNYYSYNLEMESTCASHCVKCGNSDPDPKKDSFASLCRYADDGHSDPCEQCDNIPKIIQALQGIIEDAHERNKMLDEIFEELIFELQKAHRHIYAYKKHLVRAFAQNHFWEAMIEKKDPSVVFVTQDWAMKW